MPIREVVSNTEAVVSYIPVIIAQIDQRDIADDFLIYCVEDRGVEEATYRISINAQTTDEGSAGTCPITVNWVGMGGSDGAILGTLDLATVLGGVSAVRVFRVSPGTAITLSGNFTAAADDPKIAVVATVEQLTSST